ncbi:hypothetical protein Psi02_73320 [Planotetraspora silvatica]|uniref:Uncharacterized protein n=1 Tax=Planotetraspora silvatica TaxID=234614 RepID=A0A8J3URT5_9ACTN|nr:hypothetical protein Psi02_73320 [Planotetraspora silvatica]
MAKRLPTGLYLFLAFEFASGAVTKYWAAPAHLVIMGILALANWPADWRDLLRAPAGEEWIPVLVEQAAN